MIDVESEIFSIVAKTVKEKYPKIFMTGEYVQKPSTFPCVSLIESDNQVYRNTRDTVCIENHIRVIYEVNVYSNKKNGRKSECREILGVIDEKMAELGFTRSVFTPIPNLEDATIYRLVARYRAVIGKDKTIYRR